MQTNLPPLWHTQGQKWAALTKMTTVAYRTTGGLIRFQIEGYPIQGQVLGKFEVE